MTSGPFATSMLDAPILFSAPMILAIVRGDKTVTRRLMRTRETPATRGVRGCAVAWVQPRRRIAADLPEMAGFHDLMAVSPSYRYPARLNPHGAVFAELAGDQTFGLKPGEFDFACPFTDGDTHLGNYGLHASWSRPLEPASYWTLAPTRRLWVRETWRAPAREDRQSPTALGAPAVSNANGAMYPPVWYEADRRWLRWSSSWGPPGKTRTSIHMPRWASRIALDVERIRVEKLCDITEAEAKAEGVKPFWDEFPTAGADQALTTGELAQACPYRASYAVLWDQINGARAPWLSNPWVWAITFRARVKS